MNSNMSESYKKSYGQESHPEEGTRYPAGKPNTAEDALGGSYHRSPEAVREAKEEVGVAKKCLDAQLGRGDKSMSKTGGKLGDATTHPQAGCPAENEGSGDNHI